jgi:hypothetical protein
MINKNKIMNFKKFISKFNESIKQTRLDEILDKISKKSKLTKSEIDFLDRYNDIKDEDMMDFKMLSKESTFEKISSMLEKEIKVICNLTDRWGKIGEEVISIYNNFEEEKSTIGLKNGKEVELKDNFLYNILYNHKKDEYSLESHDEYYEKIPVKDDN